MPQQRVLHFIESGGLYGAERVILNLSQKMLESGKFFPVVGCIVHNSNTPNDLYDAAIKYGIEAYKIPIANAKLLRDIPLAAKQLRELNIALIHSHGYKPSVFGFCIHLLNKIPIIATCHLWFNPKNGPLKMRAMIWLEKKLYRFFPKIVAVSEPIKAILLNNHVAANKVEVIPNGVDTSQTTMSATEQATLRSSLGLTSTDFCILNAARLDRQKGQWNLIEAAKICKQRQEPIRILIIGEGPLRQGLEQQIADSQLEDYVKLLGFRGDCDQLLQISDIFALPSLDEGMPMSLLEAAAASKPIITTLVGDIGKLITHNQSGYVIAAEDAEALANAIIQLKQQPALANKLAQNAHQQLLSKYSSTAMNQHYSLVYQQVLNDTPNL